MSRQHYRAPELVRRTACCKREAWTANGKLWCPGCGQEVLTAAKVFAKFTQGPGADVSPSQNAAPVATDPAPTYEQGAML